jgi:RNA polymerase sigma-70 factor (ECF subfamily)
MSSGRILPPAGKNAEFRANSSASGEGLKERPMGTMEDRSEFLKLFLKVQPAVRSYLLSLLRNSVDADDVFQEVSLVLWERFADYDPQFPFLNWAFGIARNHVARWRRATPRTKAWLPPEVEEKLAVTYAEIEDELAPRRNALRNCVQKLGAHAQEILTLRYEKVWSLQQIARERGMTLNAVNKALGKIRKFLSDCTGGTRMEEMGSA